MTPKKAMFLVLRYAELNRSIKTKTKEIGGHLDKCSRKGADAYVNVDEKGRDKSTHLWEWYQPFIDEDSVIRGRAIYQDITKRHEGAECPHCYAAHLVIQERKLEKRKFGIIKGQISRASND